MKKIMFLFLFAGVFFTSCFEDKGNYDYTSMSPVVVTGIESSYSRLASDDQLIIKPQLADESGYDYCWEIYRNQQIFGTIIADTITLTKDLRIDFDYNYKPGNYVIVFKARNKANDYTEIISAALEVSAFNMMGIYATKQIGNKVDMDFFYDGGVVENWMAMQNDGYQLTGNAIKTVLLTGYRSDPTVTQNQMALMTMTDSDMSIFLVEDGSLSRNFGQMFFDAPSERNIHTCTFNTGFTTLYLAMNNNVYTMLTAGGLLQEPTPLAGRKIAPFATIGMNPVYFDENSKSFLYLSGTWRTYAERQTAPVSCNGMEMDLLWMEGYQHPRFGVVALMRSVENPDIYKTVVMNTGSTYMWSYVNPITDIYTLPSGLKLPHMDVRGGNFDMGIVYFADGADVYVHDIANIEETLLFTMPGDETVTLVQHIKFPVNPTAGSDYMNQLAVATYKDGNYKIWMLDISSTGIPSTPGPTPAYTGTGMVKCMNYLEGTTGGSFVYF